jgi:hypothetical protein
MIFWFLKPLLFHIRLVPLRRGAGLHRRVFRDARHGGGGVQGRGAALRRAGGGARGGGCGFRV